MGNLETWDSLCYLTVYLKNYSELYEVISAFFLCALAKLSQQQLRNFNAAQAGVVSTWLITSAVRSYP